MKQVVQNLRSGKLELLDVPCPKVSRGHLLIQTRASLVSAGTERSLVEFGRASLIGKARKSPERVKMVLDKIRSDGLLPTLEAVFSKLDEPLPLGYCNAGVVAEIGPNVEGFSVGDRVISNGPHAEMVCVPKNLAAKIPRGVTDQQATFTVLGAIGLQGIRLLNPTLGESVAVYGLGLVGLLTVQMLKAAGIRVLGIDLDPNRLALAEKFGATPVDVSSGADPVRAALSFSGGQGVDGVLVTASAKDDSIISQSAQMSRKRGRIVLVGVVNLALSRAEFYEKELSFQVSCSYGPGRYDSAYEEGGVDYPMPFVRWTEKRNFQAVLSMLADKQLDVDPLVTSRVPHAEAARAYQVLSDDRSQMGIVFQYPQTAPPVERVVAGPPSADSKAASTTGAGTVRVGVIGAGNFTKRMLLPALAKTPAVLVSIASAKGVSSAHAARKFGFQASTTDYRTILDDPQINTVFITTRHDLHPRMIVEALDAGKHVFVEKPLAIDEEGLQLVRDKYRQCASLQLMVGFNRRFSPHAERMRRLLAGRSGPVCANMLVNAGHIPADHWAQDPKVGGGRIVGEGCHWIDLLRFLIGSPIVSVQAAMIGDVRGVATRNDHISISLAFADGSLGNVHYFANGHRAFPKEKLDVFCEGRVLSLDNFRALRGYGWPGFRKMRLLRQDKGHDAEIGRFVERIAKGGEPLIAPEEIWNVTEASFAAERSAIMGQGITV